MLFKRFGIVFSRLLLNKQDEIRQMEDELQGMDRMDNTVLANKAYLLSRDEDVKRERSSIPACWSQTRPQLLEKLETKILEYCKSSLRFDNPHCLTLCCSRATTQGQPSQSS